MTDRTALALAACDGLTDEDLAQRGPAGFAKMIDRKRKYALAARTMAAAGAVLQAEVKNLSKQLAKAQADLAAAQAKIATLEQLDAPVTDTTQAANMLAGIQSSANKETK